MHRNTSSSHLVGLLRQWAGVATEAPRQDWAQQLGSWLNPFDAIALHGAHQSIKAFAASRPASVDKARAGSLDAQWHQVRADLAQTIAAYDVPRVPEPATEVATGFAAYRQRYLELQRRMELRIEPFRDHCRRVLSQTNAALRQLAELDAALEQTLGKREKVLLTKVPGLLEKRFNHLRKQDPDGSRADGWLDLFERDFQAVIHAELTFRLEPVSGLIEALNNESSREP